MRSTEVRSDRPEDGGALADVIEDGTVVRTVRMPTVSLAERARQERRQQKSKPIAASAMRDEVEIEGDKR